MIKVNLRIEFFQFLDNLSECLFFSRFGEQNLRNPNLKWYKNQNSCFLRLSDVLIEYYLHLTLLSSSISFFIHFSWTPLEPGSDSLDSDINKELNLDFSPRLELIIPRAADKLRPCWGLTGASNKIFMH